MCSSSAMRQLEERHVATEVELLVWSNKMDLLALSNVRGEVSLHRLTWQKVWSLSPPTEGSSVRGMAWRPDGKVLAIAYSTSDILLVDVENAETLHTNHVDGPISCLNWIQGKEQKDEDPLSACKTKDETKKYSNIRTQDNASDFLPKLPSLSRSYGSINKCIEENLEDAKKIKDQTSLNILLVGTETGRLHLTVFGLFPCGIVNLKDHVSCECSVLDAEVSDDLNVLFVIVACHKTGDKHTFDSKKNVGEVMESDNTKSSEVVLVLLNTPILESRSKELHLLALEHGHIISLMNYLGQTMRSITEAWENILLEMDSKLALYAERVAEGSVSADFLDLLMFGVPSDELSMFLLHDLTEKGLKKLGHSIELSYSNIQKLVLKHLHSVGQSLLYHLAELKGMSRRDDRFRILGIDEETIRNALSAAGSFMIKATEVQQVIDNSMKNYKAFFRWLYVVILRLSEERVPAEITKITQQDLTFIADFLQNFDGMNSGKSETPGKSRKSRFNLERLGQYLIDEELTLPPETENNPWAKLLEGNPCLAEHPAIFPHFKKMSLVQQHKHLKNAIDEIFQQPELSIGKLFKLNRTLKFLDVPQPTKIKISHMNSHEDQKLQIALTSSQLPVEGFYFVEIPTMTQVDDTVNPKSCYFYFRELEYDDENSRYHVLDIQFYSPEILSILLQQKKENKSPVFLQFPTTIAVKNTMLLTDCSFGSNPMAKVPRVNATDLLEASTFRTIENMVASCFAVSGSRKVAVVLSESRRRVRLFEMEVEEEEEEEEGMDATATTKDSDNSALSDSREGDNLDVHDIQDIDISIYVNNKPQSLNDTIF